MNAEYTARFVSDVVASTVDKNTQTLSKLYAAVVAHDFEAFAKHLSDDVELSIEGLPEMSGTWRGREAVVEAARRNYALLYDQKPEMEAMISQGESIAVLFHETGIFKAEHRSYYVRGVQWFTFAGGKIRRMDQIVAPARN